MNRLTFEKVAFDIHGALDDDDDQMLRKMLEWSIERGKEVFIISGPPKEQINKELEKLGIDFSNITIISVVDWLKQADVKMWQDKKGDWWCSEDEWWASKGMICREYGIDLIFDDSYRYKKYMPESTIFVHWTGYSKRLEE